MSEHPKKWSVKQNLKVCHDLEVKGDSKLEGDVKVGGDLTVKGTTTFKGDITPISGTFSPGTDRFPTIQSIFDFLEGKAVENVLIDLLAPPSGVKIYNELIFAKNILSLASQGFAMPQSQYPLNSFSELSVVIPGLSMRGDPRYASGATYIDGAQFNTFSDQRPGVGNGYVSNLGTPYGYVDLVRPGAGQIQAVITSAPAFNPDTLDTGQEISQPDFVAAGVLPGDGIRIRDDTGVFADFVISAVAGNVLTYNGDVTALGPTAELILLPRVRITTSSASAAFGSANFSNMGITIQGVEFQNTSNGDVLEVWNNAYVKLQQSIIDGRLATGEAAAVAFGGVLGTETSGVTMHNTTMGGFSGILLTDCGRLDDGDWVFTDGFFGLYAVEATSQGHLNSANAVGGFINWFLQLGAKVDVANLLGIYSSGLIALLLNDSSQLSLLLDNLQINTNSEFGVIVNDASVLALNGGDGNDGAPYFSTVVECESAFSLDAQATVALENSAPFLIDNVDFGFVAVAGAKIGISNDIIYGPGVSVNRAMQVGTQYIAANSTETPGNVLTYTTSGILDSTIPTQVIDQPAGITLSFDPSLVTSPSNVSVYIGKRYLLSSVNTASTNTLKLLGSAIFIGAGVPAGSNQTITFGPTEGSGIDFTVLSATRVRVNSLVNGMVSRALISQSQAQNKTTKSRRQTKKVDLTKIPERYQNLVGKPLAKYT